VVNNLKFSLWNDWGQDIFGSSPWMSIKKKLLYSRLLIESCHYQLKEIRENLKLTMLAIFLEIQKVEE